MKSLLFPLLLYLLFYSCIPGNSGSRENEARPGKDSITANRPKTFQPENSVFYFFERIDPVRCMLPQNVDSETWNLIFSNEKEFVLIDYRYGGGERLLKGNYEMKNDRVILHYDPASAELTYEWKQAPDSAGKMTLSYSPAYTSTFVIGRKNDTLQIRACGENYFLRASFADGTRDTTQTPKTILEKQKGEKLWELLNAKK